MKYRSDIDGLRAVAVLIVVLFHAGLTGFSGGFVGVDVFFVISGFLITRLIHDELECGRFSLARFYERRIRRIFPALFAMLFICWLVFSWILLPEHFISLGKSQIAASLSVSNILFWRESGYFDVSAETKPLLHTWSLGVEEQFYAFFPLLMCFLYRFYRHRFATGILVATAASFALSIVFLPGHPDAVFYLLPYRAWELLMGSLLALPAFPSIRNNHLRELFALLGLALILSATFGFSKQTTFPGAGALLPVLGAAFVIYASPGTSAGRFLSGVWLVRLGRISYSLYLWHWPIFVLAMYLNPEPLGLGASFFALFLSLVVAYISWRWVEQPFRSVSRVSFGTLCKASGVAVAVALVLGGTGVLSEGLPSRLSEEARRYSAMLDKRLYFEIYDRGGCFLDYGQGVADYDVKKCTSYSPDTTITKIMLYGDSFAAHLFPGMKLLDETAYEVRQFTATSCRPIVTGRQRCDELHERFLSEILPNSGAQIVVVSAYWQPFYERFGAKEFGKKVLDSLARIGNSGKSVVLIGQTPTFYKPVPQILAMRDYSNGHSVALPARNAAAVNAVLSDVSTRAGALFIDPYEIACKGDLCFGALEEGPLHWDFGHMTLSGSLFYADRVFRSLNRLQYQGGSSLNESERLKVLSRGGG